jgi:hypothetical protein
MLEAPEPTTLGRSKVGIGLSSQDLAALTWMSEQYALRLDQLAAVMRVPGRAARAAAERLVDAGVARRRWILVDEPSWIWLTAAGQRLVGNGLKAWRPRIGNLAHVAAVNDVRLHVRARAPEAEWVCERTLSLDHRGRDHVPDAVVLTGREQHAIEVELTPKASRTLDEILAELCARYDRVVYFAAPLAKARLHGLDAEACYPKLVVRDLPSTPRALE